MRRIRQTIIYIILTTALLAVASCGGSCGSSDNNGGGPTDVSGIWDGTWESSSYGISGTFSADVIQTDATLTGTISVPDIGMYDIELKGSVQGSTMVFGDINDEITFTGKVNGDSSSGSYSYPSLNNTGTWQGKKTSFIDHFVSEKIEIRLGNTVMYINFTNIVAGEPVTLITTQSNQEEVLYDQDGVRVIRTADNEIQLIEPYDDGSGNMGILTYTVNQDQTAVQEIKVSGTQEFKFFFAGSDGVLLYQAEITEQAGALYADFSVISDGTPIGSEVVNITYHADSSQTWTFNNMIRDAYGIGPADFTVTTAVEEVDVVSTLIRSTNLRIFRTMGGDYIIKYVDSTAHETRYVVTVTGVDQDLTNPDGSTITVKSNGSVYWVRTITDGIYTFAVNPDGMAVEQTQVSGVNTYAVHIIDQISGLAKGIADIDVDARTATFRSPINDTAALDATAPSFTEIIYDFDFNNSAGNGNAYFKVVISTGNLVSTGIMYY